MDALWTLPDLVAEVATRIVALPAPKNGQVRAVPDERTVRYYGTIGLLDRPSAMRGRTALYGKKHVAQVVAIKRLQTMGRSLAEIQQLWPTLDDVTLARMSGVELPVTVKPPARAEFWKREPGQRASEAAGHAGPDHAVSDHAGPDHAGAGHAASGHAASGHAASGHAAAGHAAAGHAASGHAGMVHAGTDAEDVVGSEDADEREAMLSESPRGAVGAHGAPGAVELRIELAPHVVLSLSVTEGVVISPADIGALRAAAAPLLAELASRRLASHPEGEES